MTFDDQVLVSVIVPCFNSEKWIESAIRSVLDQTWGNLEILVYDDGSTDKSRAILESLSIKDKRIKILGDGKNHGIVHALNYLLSVANGEYIARMDSDDICVINRIEKQVTFLQEKNFDGCGSWFTEIGLGPSRVVRWEHTKFALKAAMLFQNTILHPTFLAHRKVFEHFKYRESYQLAEDYDLFVRVAQKFNLANIPEPLLYYRRHTGQATQSKRESMESVTRRIRLETLSLNNIKVSEEEKNIHNLIRAPQSIYNMADFEKIELWLLKLIENFQEPDAKEVIASQWTRTAIRAAPLGLIMFFKYKNSPIRQFINKKSDFDLLILSILKLSYESKFYSILRRFSLSA
ncbi:glycosyltransferase family 2 protein [Acinetobacter wuhouensis]|nr:glycosyltransferase [Acinetobacter wuhouensis]